MKAFDADMFLTQKELTGVRRKINLCANQGRKYLDQLEGWGT